MFVRQPFLCPIGGIVISSEKIYSADLKPRKLTKKAKQRRKIMIAAYGLSGVLLILISILLLLPLEKEGKAEPEAEETSSASSIPVFAPESKIPDGIRIAGIDVGGLTEEKAAQLLKSSLSEKCESQDMVVTYGGKSLKLTPEIAQAQWDIKSAVNAAMKGTNPEVDVEFIVNKKQVREKLTAFFDSFGGIYAPSGFWLEGEMPDLDEKNGACQTLVLNPGVSGLPIDLDDILEWILDAYRQESFSVVLEDAGEKKEPRALNLEDISHLVSVEPVNPDLDRTTLEVISGRSGYGFDLDEAAEKLNDAAPGENVRIAMCYVEPSLSEEDVWFQDILGYYKTEYTDNENRNENLRLACSKLNGIILQPGETLSYNQTLGERTSAAGYKAAPAYSGVELVDEVGGGICQVSSTLYLSSLFAELTIVERKNHGFPASYIPLGLDATVNWGTTDLKIRNDYELPVRILAEVSDGYVKVRIMGVEQRDYYVKMEYRVDDHPSYAAAYKCRYDRETDEEIYRVLDHTSIYLEEVWCYPGYAESATDEPVASEDAS